MREEKSPIRDNEMDNQEIDLLELAQKLWVERRLIFKWCAIGAVAALIIAFSIPKEYTTTIKLAPEVNDAKGGAGSLGSLASLAGINTLRRRFRRRLSRPLPRHHGIGAVCNRSV